MLKNKSPDELNKFLQHFQKSLKSHLAISNPT